MTFLVTYDNRASLSEEPALLRSYSTLKLLLRTTAWILRFVARLRKKNRSCMNQLSAGASPETALNRLIVTNFDQASARLSL